MYGEIMKRVVGTNVNLRNHKDLLANFPQKWGELLSGQGLCGCLWYTLELGIGPRIFIDNHNTMTDRLSINIDIQFSQIWSTKHTQTWNHSDILLFLSKSVVILRNL